MLARSSVLGKSRSVLDCASLLALLSKKGQTDRFDWFELQLDYNISAGGNSGIMYYVIVFSPAFKIRSRGWSDGFREEGRKRWWQFANFRWD